MKLLPCVAALVVAPLSAVALPTGGVDLVPRQGQQAPPPCVRQDPPPSQEETEARFRAFVEVFVGPKKNLYEAFKYISDDYINHNPMANNGHKAAWDVLSPFWNSFQHTYLRSTIKDNMSWVNYRAGFMGEVVDRFRWEGGCIVEHWDQGERYPSV
ncbi:hypothetical protein VTJ83DRAFT_7592 [Remersonia thermophila]|uniref:SnoaL-like domain-containing protein n=1 Tax=Remersonia thermophila TaxID=72144 RepID=A0ABR4D6A3_9PEZI